MEATIRRRKFQASQGEFVANVLRTPVEKKFPSPIRTKLVLKMENIIEIETTVTPCEKMFESEPVILIREPSKEVGKPKPTQPTQELLQVLSFMEKVFRSF